MMSNCIKLLKIIIILNSYSIANEQNFALLIESLTLNGQEIANLNLYNNVSYFLDQNLYFDRNLTINGENTEFIFKFLTSDFFHFANNSVNFIGISFYIENQEKIDLNSIFSFENSQLIIFQGCSFNFFLENIIIFNDFGSTELKMINCTIQNSLLLNSSLLLAKKTKYLLFENFLVKNNSFENSYFFVFNNTQQIDFREIFIFQNFLNFTIILNFDEKPDSLQRNLECDNLTILNCEFFNFSYLLSYNSISTGENFTFNQMKVQNNIFENSFLKVNLDFEEYFLFFNEILILENNIKNTFLEIFDQNSFQFKKQIFFQNFAVGFNNLALFIPFTQQYLILVQGDINIKIDNCNFLYNLCYLGPCVFFFLSDNQNFLAFISNSTFSSNLAFYINENDISYGVISLYGSVQIYLSNITVQNNSICKYIQTTSYYQNGEQGNPFLISDDSLSSLFINNSFFLENSGYGESSCIFFKGSYFELINSTFQKQFTSEGNEIFALIIDCTLTNFTNVIFSKGTGGVISFNTQKETMTFVGNNVLIVDNIAWNTNMLLITQQMFITFNNFTFNSNKCYNRPSLLYIYNSASDYENHVLIFCNSSFINNQAIETVSTGLFEIRAIGILLNISNSFFIKNTASGDLASGSVLYSNMEITTFSNFFQCYFINNSATTGGVFYILLGTLICEQCFLEGNAVLNSNDGILSIGTYSDGEISYSNFSKNIGSILKASQRCTFEIFQTVFSENVFELDSKAFTLSLLASGFITQCSFINQIGYSNGFLVTIFNTLSTITFDNNYIVNCTSVSGSLFYIDSASIMITNLIIIKCNGTLFFLSAGILYADTISVSDQNCIDSVCFSILMLYSKIELINFIIKEIFTTSKELISVESSEISFSNGLFTNITCSIKNIYVIVTRDANLTMMNFKASSVQLTFFYSTKSYLNISLITIISNFQNFISFLKSVANKLITINNSTFFGFSNIKGGAIDNDNTNIFINSNIFLCNNALNGGAIYTKNSNISLYGNQFYNNTAEYGAGIYFSSDNLILELKMENNNFSLNRVLYGGGAFFNIYNMPSIVNNYYFNNSAEYGQDYASTPIILSMESNISVENILKNYLPSSLITNEIIFYFKDIYNNTIKKGVSGKATLSLASSSVYNANGLNDESENKKQLYGPILSDYSTYGFIFKNIKINFKPKSFVVLSFSSETIHNFEQGSFNYNFPHFLDANENYYYLLIVNSTECPIGFLLDYDSNSCSQCSSGEYSFNSTEYFCHKCPDNTICDSNGSFIDVMPGYWRSDYYSTLIIECFLPDACLGKECRDGYEGPLCDTCITNEQAGQYKSLQSGCSKCQEVLTSYILMGIVIVLIVVYIIFTLRVNLKLINKMTDNKSKFVNLLIRIITDYFQILSTVLKIKITFLFGIGSFFDKFSLFSDFLGNFFSFLYPLDCFYSTFATKELNVFYINLVLLVFIYPIIFLLNLLFWIIWSSAKKKKFGEIKDNWFASLFLISYMLQPSFINEYFKYINCISIGDQLYVRSYLTEKCWEGTHLFYFCLLIFPSLFFWIIIYPTIILYLLRKEHINRLKKSILERDKDKFSFFKDGLKEDFYYWEILMMFRKYVFIILSIFPLSETMLLNLWAMSIFAFITLIIQIRENPFEFPKAIIISLIANGLILLTIIGMMLVLIKNSMINEFIIIFLFLTLNLYLLIKWIIDIFIIKIKEIELKVNSLKKSFEKVIRHSTVNSLLKSKESKNNSFVKIKKSNFFND